MTAADCQLYLEGVLAPLCTIWPSAEIYHTALDIHERTGFSFYDSLIVAAALEADCEILYSEDMQDGRKVDASGKP
jgi:predicted nucleic acid-binding protein